ncbi:MAG: ABC transporter permease [Eubacteriales bacterium]|nr:ABC transporter permease [Eubacteriales bacterium]
MLFDNDTKAVIKLLSKRSFRKSRTRNIAAILAIAMTAFLFTSIISLAFGVQSSIVLSLQMEKGSKADGSVGYMTKEQFNKLNNSDFVEQAGCRQFIGYTSNSPGHAIEINYADSIQQELTFSTPSHGRAPQAPNEITTTDRALKALGIEPEVGANVPVEFTLRGQSYHFDMVVSGWWESSQPGISLMIVSQSFMEENGAAFPNTYAFDKEISGTFFSNVILKNKTNVQGQLKEFARSAGGNPVDMTADNYVQCTDDSVAKVFMQPSVAAVVIGFIILFILCGYLLIYNIFDISVKQDVRQFGLLRTIGTTTRQIKKVVKRQAVTLTLIGLPIGLVTGLGVGYVLLPFVVKSVNNNSAAVQFSVSPLIFAAAALFTIVTVIISTRKPVKKATKVSPLEAVQYTGSNIVSKKKKKRQNGAKLPYMAFSNVGRNRRRSAFIILSMLLCIVLFNSVIIITQSLDVEKGIRRTTKTDFLVYNSACANRVTGFSSRNDALNASAIEQIKEQTGITNERYLYRNTIEDTDVTVDYGFKDLQAERHQEINGRNMVDYGNGSSVWVPTDNDQRFFGNVFGASEEFFDDLVIYEGETAPGVLKQKLDSGEYIIVGTPINRLTGEPITGQPFYDQLRTGDKVTFYKGNEPYQTFTVLAMACLVNTEIEIDQWTNSVTKIGGDAPLLYLPENIFTKIYEEPVLLNYGFDAEGTKEQMTQFLDNLTAQDPTTAYTSSELIASRLQTTCNIIFMVGGMIACIFALAGLINFTNMMITNIVTRQQEFATMQSIGMTGRQLRQMMIWEGLYYALGAGTFGCGIAALIGLTVLRSALNSSSMWYFTLHFTMIPGLLIAGLYFIMAMIIPVIALKAFHKGSVVDRLRKSE